MELMTRLEELRKEIEETRRHNFYCDEGNEWDEGSIALDVIRQLIDHVGELEKELRTKQTRIS